MVALMIKTVTVLLNFAFKWLRLVNETHTIRLVQAGKQANQLACTVDHTGNAMQFLQEIAQAKVSFYLS